MLLQRMGAGHTEVVEGLADSAIDGSLCKGRVGVDALDIVSWPPRDAVS
jgi:hypothetical protein